MKRKVKDIFTIERKCYCCKKILPIYKFITDNHKKYHKAYICKICKKKKQKEWKSNNLEKVKNSKRNYYYKQLGRKRCKTCNNKNYLKKEWQYCPYCGLKTKL